VTVTEIQTNAARLRSAADGLVTALEQLGP
jgi:hypothetical protein